MIGNHKNADFARNVSLPGVQSCKTTFRPQGTSEMLVEKQEISTVSTC